MIITVNNKQSFLHFPNVTKYEKTGCDSNSYSHCTFLLPLRM